MKIFVSFFTFASLVLAAPFSYKKADWINNAVSTVRQPEYKKIQAMSYWHESWKDEKGKSNQLKIDSSFTALYAYRKSVQGKDFVTKAELDSQQKLLPPKSGRYLAAYPNFGPLENLVSTYRIYDYESLSRRKIVWAYFSDNWGDEIRYPEKAIQDIKRTGKIPFVRIMLRKTENPTQFGRVDLHSIVLGKFDEDIKKWGKQAKELNGPLLIEFCPEANGDWFAWSGVKVTPALYVEAHKKIANLLKEAGATNLTWFFHMNAGSSPESAWNNFKSYYPGNEIIDWVGLSVYGPHTQTDGYRTFESVLTSAYQEMTQLAPDKPLAILEWGIGEGRWKK